MVKAGLRCHQDCFYRNFQRLCNGTYELGAGRPDYNGSDSIADLAITEIFLCFRFLLYKMGTTILQRK